MPLQLSVVPEKAIVVRRGRTAVAASWFGRWVRRPHVYPFLAPGDIEVTRLGHPKDPIGHSHHRSIWIGHASIGGVDFWGESPRSGSIEQTEILSTEKEGDAVGARIACAWRAPDGKTVLVEKRRMTFHDLPAGEEHGLALDLEMELAPPGGEPITLGKTNFGMLGIRVARSMRVHEKLGGRITNSGEAEDEAGCFGQHATWCDYSGPATTEGGVTARGSAGSGPTLTSRVVGIACFDHPKNPGEGVLWHVRDDGWMGPSLTRTAPITIAPGKPLVIRYRVISHAGYAGSAGIGDAYRVWRRRQQ